MRGDTDMRRYRWWLIVLIFGLSLLGSMSLPAVTTAQTAGAICTIRVFGNGDLMAVFSTPPTNFGVAALVPTDKDLVMPVLCDDLGNIGLAVGSQEKNKEITFTARVFDHDGIMFCLKGPFTIPPRGGTGVTFASCPEP
jgi:hypothetical protein